ncbi:MAG: PAS domain S-box protein [Candidatus Aminicenantales bacterium]
MKSAERPKFNWLVPLIIFLPILLCAILGGWIYYRVEKRGALKEASISLDAIAEMKIDQIVNWRKEILANSFLISQNPFTQDRLIPFLEGTDSPDNKVVADEIRSWLEILVKAFGYIDAVLLDNRGNIRLFIGRSPARMGVNAENYIAEICSKGVPQFSDLHRIPDIEEIHFDLYAPICPSREPGKKLPCPGLLFFRIDPGIFLFPLVQSMPIPRSTAETILVRREGNEIVFLNKPRFRAEGGEPLRLPADAPALPAALAVQGREGAVEGVDYRGVPVLAILRPIPGTPWFMVAKEDMSELLLPLRLRMTGLVIFVTGLLFGLGILLLFWVKKREARFYRGQYEAERDRLALVRHFEYLHKYANDIILLADRFHRIIEANDQACAAYGYTREELLGLSIPDLRPSGLPTSIEESIRKAVERTGWIFETQHQRKDGTVFPVEISLRVFETGGEKYHQAIIRDITERKRAEEALEKSNQKYRALFETANDPIFLLDGDRFIDCNQKTLIVFGGRKSEILGKTPFDFSPPEQPDGTSSKEKATEKIKAALAGESQVFEWKHRKLDGTEMDTEVNLNRTEVDGRMMVLAIVRDITEWKKTESRLKAAIGEKELLLREIHHRVKNNMQVISSLLSLQSKRFRDKGVLEAFKESQTRIRTMALIHEKLYQTRDLSRIDISDYVTNLVSYLFRAYRIDPARIGLETDLARKSLDINTSIPCALIINELVSNALKHAFPGGKKGLISIRLSEDGDGILHLEVRDDGVGLPAAIDIHRTESLGIQIVMMLAEQLEGRVGIERVKGTAFRIDFRPLPYKPRL